MNITLPAEQERWLKKRIANGEFHSAEDAVRQLIAERMIIDDDDMAWARPLVDEARAAIAQGDKVSLEEAELDIDRVLASLKR
jgi:antitoxin ParD1/3/4